MLKHPRTWSVHDVLSVLYSLVKKSGINEQLSYYAKQGKFNLVYWLNYCY